MTAFDLNADVGEGVGNDEELLAIVTSASIACGGHAGNDKTMRTTLRAAHARGLRIGAHPGFADPEHFGRRRLDLTPAEVATQVLDQIGALEAIAAEEGIGINYVKLHGALANMAAEDDGLARAVFSAVAGAFPHLAVLALENSAQQRACEALGLAMIAEAYADRAYLPNGLLAPRTLEGSVIHDRAAVVARCVRLATKGEIVAIDGTVNTSTARSICLHGDTEGAVALAGAVREALEAAGVLLKFRTH